MIKFQMERKKKMNEGDLCIWRERTAHTLDDSRKVSQPLSGREGKESRDQKLCPEFHLECVSSTELQ